MTNTNNPMNRFDAWCGDVEWVIDGSCVDCEDVTDYIQYLQEQGLSSEEILNKVVEELS